MKWVEKTVDLKETMIGYYSSKGYTYLPPVAVSSHIDPTVYLVNSATNLFKPYFSQANIHVLAAQRSMRTQILSDYYCKSKETKYPSCFMSLGAYVSLEHIDQLFADTYGFLLKAGFYEKYIRVRGYSKDSVLLDPAKRVIGQNRIQLDDNCEKYDHKYGGGVKGRVIKLDYFSNRLQRYKNIGYIIAIFFSESVCGVEFASSCEQILLRLGDLDYAVSTNPIADFLPTGTFEERRLADSIMGTINLVHEGLWPNSSNTNGRTLKKYMAALSYFITRVSLSDKEVLEQAMNYYLSQFKDADEITLQKVFSALKEALSLEES